MKEKVEETFLDLKKKEEITRHYEDQLQCIEQIYPKIPMKMRD